MGTVFSGIQPTGSMHLGNYLGAVRLWRHLQDNAEQCLYSVVDLHALTATTPPTPTDVREGSLHMAAALLACGIDPERSVVFRQSDVSGHAELQWVLSSVTPLGWLQRQVQFKEKGGASGAKLGLLAYPVLMSADVLLYGATHVPVGDDQRQHLELARDIARTFNKRYGKLLVEPASVHASATRVMSLRDATKKMSKSDPVPGSRINVSDSADEIARKVRRATTDSERGITFEPERRPGVSNLVSVMAALTDTTPEHVCAQFAGASTAQFKGALTDALVAELCPVGREMAAVLAEPNYVEGVLAVGADRARALSAPILHDIHKAMGLR